MNLLCPGPHATDRMKELGGHRADGRSGRLRQHRRLPLLRAGPVRQRRRSGGRRGLDPGPLGPTRSVRSDRRRPGAGRRPSITIGPAGPAVRTIGPRPDVAEISAPRQKRRCRMRAATPNTPVRPPRPPRRGSPALGASRVIGPGGRSILPAADTDGVSDCGGPGARSARPPVLRAVGAAPAGGGTRVPVGCLPVRRMVVAEGAPGWPPAPPRRRRRHPPPADRPWPRPGRRRGPVRGVRRRSCRTPTAPDGERAAPGPPAWSPWPGTGATKEGASGRSAVSAGSWATPGVTEP